MKYWGNIHTDLHHLFHVLWTKAVGTPYYNKQEWKNFDAMLSGILDRSDYNDQFSGPEIEGSCLAKYYIEKIYSGQHVIVIDLRGFPSRLLISSFFHSFFQTFYNKDPSLIDILRSTATWKTSFDFQEENIKRWLEDFSGK